MKIKWNKKVNCNACTCTYYVHQHNVIRDKETVMMSIVFICYKELLLHEFYGAAFLQ